MSVIMLHVIMLNAIVLSVIMLNVVILSAVAPFKSVCRARVSSLKELKLKS
jgi:hypothetical protein